MKLKYYKYIIIILCLSLVMYNIFKENEQFENITEDIGNVLSEYFHSYALSICNQTDFYYKPDSKSDIIKHLPKYIQFNPELHSKFNEHGITFSKLDELKSYAIWHCDQDWIIDMWIILKQKIHNMLKTLLNQSWLKPSAELYPIIHLRCADVPFSKHYQYFLQRYDFFKIALSRINFDNNPNKTIVIMNCSTHNSGEPQKEACSKYVNKLSEYLNGQGYNCITQCKTNLEDFADIFYSPVVISTGGSFSFFSGLFGDGQFISTEHKEENKSTCNNDNCNGIFIKGYNISHNTIYSYYDVDTVHTQLLL